MSEFLTSDELQALTDRAHRKAQAEVLRTLGLPFKEVGRRLVVSREHARAWLRGERVAPVQAPNFEAIR